MLRELDERVEVAVPAAVDIRDTDPSRTTQFSELSYVGE
jgi:hypothetical protein